MSLLYLVETVEELGKKQGRKLWYDLQLSKHIKVQTKSQPYVFHSLVHKTTSMHFWSLSTYWYILCFLSITFFGIKIVYIMTFLFSLCLNPTLHFPFVITNATDPFTSPIVSLLPRSYIDIYQKIWEKKALCPLLFSAPIH